MKHNLNLVNLYLKLLLLTVLISIATSVLVLNYFNNASYTADSTRVLIVAGQELNSDHEPTSGSQPTFDVLIFSLSLTLAGFFVISFTVCKNIKFFLTFLYHIRPRSPPHR